MATAMRRNTFILKGPALPQPSNQSGMDRQNIMRLKVNRIALVQELKVEHVIDRLMDARILNEKDRRKIEGGTTPSDRARILIDLLPTKDKDTEWYKHFRETLIDPDASMEFKRRYRLLVEFLDNTVIHRPVSQAGRFSDEKTESLKYPKYEPLPPITGKNSSKTQNVLNLEDRVQSVSVTSGNETETVEVEKGPQDSVPGTGGKSSPWSFNSHESMTLIKGFFHQWVPTPDNFKSLVEIPADHLRSLQDSDLQEDKTQLEEETKTLQRMKTFEIVVILARRKQLPSGFELCMCDALHDILREPQVSHYYYKYFKKLLSTGINLVKDIEDSFQSVLTALEMATNKEATERVVSTGFKIVELFTKFSCYVEAQKVLYSLLMFLNTNPCIETWMAKYKGFVKLMHLRNKNYDYPGVQQAYFLATQMTWQINMMSFGQDLLNEAELFMELSNFLQENGSLSSAMGWANRAIQEVQAENHAAVINMLCNAVMTHCAKWQVKKAGMLAIQAVQQAKYHFGKRHPLYLKSLLHFCHFSSEFLQDEVGLDVTKVTLKTARKIYGCETIQLALAHRAVSKALMVLQRFDNDEYYSYSMEAIRIARSLLPPGHPMLHIFLHTFASALQWKSLHCPKEIKDSTLRWAEAEAKQALQIVVENYGDISLRAAQIYSLLGQIYSKMERLDEAERYMVKTVQFMKLCQPADSNYLLLAMATLGTFYKILQRPKEAVSLLKSVVTTVENTNFYLKWVHACYENLISTLQSISHFKDADEIHILLSQWLRDNPKDETVISMEILDAQPQPFSQFLEVFDKWKSKVKKVKNQFAEKKDF